MDWAFRYQEDVHQTPESEHILPQFANNPCHFRALTGRTHELDLLHRHNYMQLWYCVRGSFLHNYNGKEFCQKRGDFIFVPPFIPHQLDTRISDNVEFIFCDLSDGFINMLSDAADKNTLFNLAYLKPCLVKAHEMQAAVSFSGEDAAQLEALLFELVDEFQSGHGTSTLYIRTLLLRILSMVCHKYQAFAPSREDELFFKYRTSIQNALNYIDTNYTQNITLQEISKIALMSVRSFSYVFKEITGETFVSYLNFLRIRHARNLLIKTNKSLTTICLECGYHDLQYFTRIFKKLTKLPPGLYRKQHQKSANG